MKSINLIKKYDDCCPICESYTRKLRLKISISTGMCYRCRSKYYEEITNIPDHIPEAHYWKYILEKKNAKI